MASAAEQLAANINFSSLTKSEDLKNRLWFTLGALIVYRLGSYIPIPGIDTAEVAKFAAQNATSVLGGEFGHFCRINAGNWNVGAETVYDQGTQREPQPIFQVL